MSSSKRSAKGFNSPRPLVRINSSMAGGGDRTAITQEQSLDALTEASLKKMQKAADPVEPKPAPVAKESEAEAPATVSLTKENIEMIAKTAADKAVAEAREQLESAHAAEKEALQSELDASKEAAAQATEAARKAAQEKDVLAGVFNTLGYTDPVQPKEAKAKEMTTTSASSRLATKNPEGAVKEALDILEASPCKLKTASGGSQFVYADQAELNRFIHQNKEAVIHDLERWGKGIGLLKGKNTVAQTYGQTKAATTIGDIPGGFLDVLSAVMRSENRGRFVMWQFPITVHQFDLGQGNQAEIPRAPYIAPPATSDSRLLSGGGVYRPIDPGNQNIQTGIELATLQEWGLGATPDAAPVMIPTFINSYSMIDLMMVLQRNLMRDYYAFEEVAIREKYKLTNAIVYNSAGNVTSTPTVGTMTSLFLNKLFAYMGERGIPTYENGCYVLVQPSSVIADFKNSLQGTNTLWQAPNTNDLMALTNILNPTTIGTGQMDKVTGYVGTYCNFMIFDTNAYGVGAATVGGTNGVRVENIGGNVDTRSGFAFGADAVGRGVGTEFQIVQDEKTDFGRSNRFIWKSEEAFAALDVAPQAGDTRLVPQQLRVLETRFVVA